MLGAAGAAPLSPPVIDDFDPRVFTVLPPPIEPRSAPDVDLAVLGHWRARLPAHDTGKIFAVIPAKREPPAGVTWALVRAEVIVPLLRAVRFNRGAEALRAPPPSVTNDRFRTGIPQPTATLADIAQLLSAEYGADPKAASASALHILSALRGQEPGPDVEPLLAAGRGMGLRQFKANIERKEFIYPFVQTHAGVPIEHTVLLASRWEGQSVTSVRGALIHRYTLPPGPPVRDFERPPEAVLFGELDQLHKSRTRTSGTPTLVLLPYGTHASDGSVQLHYAWRVPVDIAAHGRSFRALAWIRADDALAESPFRLRKILKLLPLDADAQPGSVEGRGRSWQSDPGSGRTPLRSFDVDAPATDAPRPYDLRRFGFVERLALPDFGAGQEVSIPDLITDQQGSYVDFGLSRINEGARAACAKGNDFHFQQVNFYATLHNHWRHAITHGIYAPFPATAWKPGLEVIGAGCNASPSMEMGACQGYYDTACPDFSTGGNEPENYLNFAHDATIVGHEVAHRAIQRYTHDRPPDWCGSVSCTLPLGWGLFHDLADAWADHIENTNCTGGWVAKNLGGINASFGCQGTRGHDADGRLPRLHEVSLPFNPASPGNHFPEGRGHPWRPPNNYMDMQIPAAALWQVREGMRSLEPVSGGVQYFVRFAHALRNTGFLGADIGDSDRAAYRYLHDLLLEMLNQWGAPLLQSSNESAPQGDRTINKVLAGFARAGLFAIPVECLDESVLTASTRYCASGTNGADAIIDVDDGDASDDVTAGGRLHPERDYLRVGGPAPLFHIWTGAAYRFRTADGRARPVSGTAVCNSKFFVEVSPDESFASPKTVRSAWVGVNTDNDNATSPACYGTWRPTLAQWMQLQQAGVGKRLYYRARTDNAAATNARWSDRPAGGLWVVPPPYTLLTVSGKAP